MEDEDLDELVNLIDQDSDDEFIDQLYDNDDHQQSDSTSTDNNQDIVNTSNNGSNSTEKQDEQVSPENMSRRMTEMEKYIKFLEAQLKTKNEEKKKSPENKSNKENISTEEEETKSTTKKFYSQSMPARNPKKEDSSSQKKPVKTPCSTSPGSSDGSFVKKPRVAHTAKTSESCSASNARSEKMTVGKKRKAEEPPPHISSAKKQAQDTSSSITDGFSGLRIVNPLVSSTVMERRMEGRKIFKISSLQSKVRKNDIEGDWVTIGVLIQKLPKKTTKGEMYSLWKLSDLEFHLQTSTIVLFLFGENHKEHWKTAEGSVVAVLNPAVLPPREKQSSDVALSLDNPKKLMMIGMSQDFGVCQSSRKSDGKRCSNFINKAEGNYCQYHVQREYSKTRSKRMECQQGYGAPSKLSGSKLKQKVASESFIYGGKIVSASPIAPPRKEKVSLKNLPPSSSAGKDYLNSWKEKQNERNNCGESPGDKNGPSEDFLSLLNVPTVGSRNLKLHLHKEEEKEKDENEAKPVLSASEFLKANNLQRKKEKQPTSCGSKTRTKPLAEATNVKDSPGFDTPVLGRGLSLDDDIVFDENILLNSTRKSSKSQDRAKNRALALVRRNGSITPTDPNNVRAKKPSPKLQDAIKSKLDQSEEEEPVSNSGKKFSLADGFSFDSAEAQRILKAKSKHVGEVRQAELEEEQVYFRQREKKEEMEKKMLSTKEIKVRVFQCMQCQYVAEKPTEKCKEENHTLQSLHVMKKFFSCRDCGERAVAYGQRCPTRKCRKCGAKNWEKCGMWKGKNGPKLGGETLMVRGPEYAKFLNSLAMPKTNGILPKYL